MGGQAIIWGGDQCGSSEPGAIKIRGERNNQNGLQQPSQCVALPENNGASTGLLLGSIDSEIGPPDFAPPQARSSRSSAAAQSPSPASARARSSSPCAASPATSQ